MYYIQTTNIGCKYAFMSHGIPDPSYTKRRHASLDSRLIVAQLLARDHILICAPIPPPVNHTVCSQAPILTPTVACASSFKVPPRACLTASRPTLSKLQSTGSRGEVVAPGSTAKGSS